MPTPVLISLRCVCPTVSTCIIPYISTNRHVDVDRGGVRIHDDNVTESANLRTCLNPKADRKIRSTIECKVCVACNLYPLGEDRVEQIRGPRRTESVIDQRRPRSLPVNRPMMPSPRNIIRIPAERPVPDESVCRRLCRGRCDEQEQRREEKEEDGGGSGHGDGVVEGINIEKVGVVRGGLAVLQFPNTPYVTTLHPPPPLHQPPKPAPSPSPLRSACTDGGAGLQ